MSDFPSGTASPDDRNVACRICDGRDLANVEVREMMFGLREQFRYRECRACGCLQIAEYLDNIEKYYPNDYYSFSAVDPRKFYDEKSWKRKYQRIVKEHLINFSRSTRSWFLDSDNTRQWLKSRPVASLYLKHVPNPKARILDVGCGSGAILGDLFHLYYTNIHGCDPFISHDIFYNGRPLIRKAWLRDLSTSYDCISFHHVFEHMPDQLAVLKEAGALLAPNGLLMIRIPVLGGAAWRSYHQDWVQLDAPRHYYLHSEGSFTLLAEKAGLDVQSIHYDSTGFQFWGSEMYRRDIPLVDIRKPGKSLESFFPAEQLAEYETRAETLNQLRDGDQIVAILGRK